MGQGDFRIHFDSDIADFASILKGQFKGINSELTTLTESLKARANEINAILGGVGAKQPNNVAARLNSALGLDQLGKIADSVAGKLSASIEKAMVEGINRGIGGGVGGKRLTIPIRLEYTGELPQQVKSGGKQSAVSAVRLLPAEEPTQGRGRPTVLTVPPEAIQNIRDARAAMVDFTKYVRTTGTAAQRATEQLGLLVAELNGIKAGGGAGLATGGSQPLVFNFGSGGGGVETGARAAGVKAGQAHAEGFAQGAAQAPLGKVRRDLASKIFTPSDDYVEKRTAALRAADSSLKNKAATERANAELEIARALKDPAAFFSRTGGVPKGEGGQERSLADLNANQLISAITRRLRESNLERLANTEGLSPQQLGKGQHAVERAYGPDSLLGSAKPKEVYQHLFEAFQSVDALAKGFTQFSQVLNTTRQAAEGAAKETAKSIIPSGVKSTSEEVSNAQQIQTAVKQLGRSSEEALHAAQTYLRTAEAQRVGGVIGAAGRAEKEHRENIFRVQGAIGEDIRSLLPTKQLQEASRGLSTPDLIAHTRQVLSERPNSESKIKQLDHQVLLLQQTFASLERVPTNAKKGEDLKKRVASLISADEEIYGRKYLEDIKPGQRRPQKELDELNALGPPSKNFPGALALQLKYDEAQLDRARIAQARQSGRLISLPPLLGRDIPGERASAASGGAGAPPIKTPIGNVEGEKGSAVPSRKGSSSGFINVAGGAPLTEVSVRAEIERLNKELQKPGKTGNSLATLKEELALYNSIFAEIQRIKLAQATLTRGVLEVTGSPGFLPSQLAGTKYARGIQEELDQRLAEEENLKKGRGRNKFPEEQTDTGRIDASIQRRARTLPRQPLVLADAVRDLLQSRGIQVDPGLLRGRNIAGRLGSDILNRDDPAVQANKTTENVRGLNQVLKTVFGSVGALERKAGSVQGRDPAAHAAHQRDIDEAVASGLKLINSALDKIFGQQADKFSPEEARRDKVAQKQVADLNEARSKVALAEKLHTRRNYAAATLNLSSILTVPGTELLDPGPTGIAARQKIAGKTAYTTQIQGYTEEAKKRLLSIGKDAVADIGNLHSLLATYPEHFGDVFNASGVSLRDAITGLRNVGNVKKAAAKPGYVPDIKANLTQLAEYERRINAGDRGLVQELTGKRISESTTVTPAQANAERLRQYAPLNAEIRKLRKREAELLKTANALPQNLAASTGLDLQPYDRNVLPTHSNKRVPLGAPGELGEVTGLLHLFHEELAKVAKIRPGTTKKQLNDPKDFDPASGESPAGKYAKEALDKIARAKNNPANLYGSVEAAEKKFIDAINLMFRNLISGLTGTKLGHLGDLSLDPLFKELKESGQVKTLDVGLKGYGEDGLPSFDTSGLQKYLSAFAKKNAGKFVGGKETLSALSGMSAEEQVRYFRSVGSVEEPGRTVPHGTKGRTKKQELSGELDLIAEHAAEAAVNTATVAARKSGEDLLRESRERKLTTQQQDVVKAAVRGLQASSPHALDLIAQGDLQSARLELQRTGRTKGEAYRAISDVRGLKPAERRALEAEANALGAPALRQRYAGSAIERLGPEGSKAAAEAEKLQKAYEQFTTRGGQAPEIVKARVDALIRAVARLHEALVSTGVDAGRAFSIAAYSLGLTETKLEAAAGGGRGKGGGGGGKKPPTGTGGPGPEDNPEHLANLTELQNRYNKSVQDGAAYYRLLQAEARQARAIQTGDQQEQLSALNEVNQARAQNTRAEGRNAFDRYTTQREGGVAARLFRGVGSAVNRYTGDLVVFAGAQHLQQTVSEAFQLQREFIRVNSGLEAVNQSSAGLKTNLGGIASDLGAPLKDVYQTASELVGVFQNTKDLTFAVRVVEQLKLISDGALSTQEAFRGFASISAAYGQAPSATYGQDVGKDGEPIKLNQTANIKRFADYVTQAQNLTGTNVADIVEGTGRLAPEAKAFNISLPTLVGLIAEVSKRTGQSGEATGEQLSRALATLQSTKVQGILTRGPTATRPGINAATAEELGTGQYGIILRRLIEKVAKGEIKENDPSLAELKHAIGGGRQAAVIQSLIGSKQAAKATLGVIEGVTEDSYGAADKRAKKIIDTFAGQISRFGANISGLAQVIVSSGLLDLLGLMFKEFNDLAGALVKTLGGLEDFINSLGVLGDAFKLIILGSLGLKATAFVVQGFFRSFRGLQEAVGGGGGGGGFFGTFGRRASRGAALSEEEAVLASARRAGGGVESAARAGLFRNEAGSIALLLGAQGLLTRARGARLPVAGFAGQVARLGARPAVGSRLAFLGAGAGATAAEGGAIAGTAGLLTGPIGLTAIALGAGAFFANKRENDTKKHINDVVQNLSDDYDLTSQERVDTATKTAKKVRDDAQKIRPGTIITGLFNSGTIAGEVPRDAGTAVKKLGGVFGNFGQSLNDLGHFRFSNSLENLGESGRDIGYTAKKLVEATQVANAAGTTYDAGKELFQGHFKKAGAKFGSLIFNRNIGEDAGFDKSYGDLTKNAAGFKSQTDKIKGIKDADQKQTAAAEELKKVQDELAKVSDADAINKLLDKTTGPVKRAEAAQKVFEVRKNLEEQAATLDAIATGINSAIVFTLQQISDTNTIFDSFINLSPQTLQNKNVQEGLKTFIGEKQTPVGAKKYIDVLTDPTSTLDQRREAEKTLLESEISSARQRLDSGKVTEKDREGLTSSLAENIRRYDELAKAIVTDRASAAQSLAQALVTTGDFSGAASQLDTAISALQQQRGATSNQAEQAQIDAQIAQLRVQQGQYSIQPQVIANNLVAAQNGGQLARAQAAADNANLAAGAPYAPPTAVVDQAAAQQQLLLAQQQQQYSGLQVGIAQAKLGGSPALSLQVQLARLQYNNAVSTYGAGTNEANQAQVNLLGLQRTQVTTSTEAQNSIALGRIDPRDKIALAAQQAVNARRTLSITGQDDPAYGAALQQLQQAKISHLQAQIELVNSQTALKVLPGDRFATAVEHVREARTTLQGLKKGTADYNKQLAQLVQAQSELAQEASHAKSVAYSLSHDITNPLTEAANVLREARAKLARDLKSGKATRQQIREDELAVKQAQASYESTQFNRNLNIARINYELGKSASTANAAGALSYKQYVAYLESEQRRLLAIKNRTDQQTQELGQVTDTLNALKASLQGQFNLGDIKVPTPYEARKFITEQIAHATAAATSYAQNATSTSAVAAQSFTGATSTANTSSTNNVSVSINGGDLNAVKTVLAQYIGPSAFGRGGTTTAKV